jgi:hypothetical protein
VGEDNRLAPPGGMLLNIDRLPRLDRPGELAQPRPDGREELSETRSGGPRAAAGTVPSVATPGRPPAAEPSWGRVLATTLRLWLRRQVTVRRWRTVGVVAAAVVTVAALALTGVFSGTAAPAARVRAASTPSPAQATTHPTTAPSVAQPSPAQTAAAAWIASQLSSDATIGCDPVMCTALQAQGVTAARLMPLEPGSPGPHGATVMVTSDAAAAQYAPAVIASFGSGAAQVDVRATEPGGAAAYQTALRADQAARMSAGSQLLRNNRIHFTAQDAAQLRAGQVDARLLATLAALSSQYSFSVTAFGDASPGVAMPYREVTITAAGQDLTAALALLKAQVPPFLPTQAAIMHLAAGPAVLSIEYAAPSPLGLLTAVLDVATRR